MFRVWLQIHDIYIHIGEHMIQLQILCLFCKYILIQYVHNNSKQKFGLFFV